MGSGEASGGVWSCGCRDFGHSCGEAVEAWDFGFREGLGKPIGFRFKKNLTKGSLHPHWLRRCTIVESGTPKPAHLENGDPESLIPLN